MTTFLANILALKREEVAQRRRREPDAELEARLSGLPPTRSLFDALSPAGGPVQVIAEVKRASPSVGKIDAGVDAAALAAQYAGAGAAAISVLTDGPGFGGSLEDLSAARKRVQVPLLRKDFVLDRYQLLEARLAGADAALLIVAALPKEQLAELMAAAKELSLETLVEVHDEAELEIAHAVGSRLIGVNNRNLKTFEVDLATCERVLPRIDPSARAVAESGVKGPAEVKRLRAVGAANFLVGEALVRAKSPAELLQQLREA